MFVNNFESSLSGIAYAADQLLNEGEARGLCALEQYARVNALRQACDVALIILQDAAVKETVKMYPKSEGEQFVHNGLTFQFKRKAKYSFEGIPSWDIKKALVDRADKALKQRKTELKSVETVYLAKHPELKPSEIGLSVAFCAK